MIPLNENEVNEIINLAYDKASEYILSHISKKEFENIDITINLDTTSDSFSIDIDINLDSDIELPANLSNKAIDLSLEAVDKYVEDRNNKLNS